MMSRKNTTYLIVRAILFSATLFGTVFTFSTSVHAQFKDVDQNHQFYEAVQWAHSENIFNGYEDGTFKPATQLTNAHFAKVIANYFDLAPVEGTVKKNLLTSAPNESHWADSYYDMLASYSAPIPAYHMNTARNQPIARGYVALTLAHFTSDEKGLDNAIQFLLNNGITTGQSPKYKDTNFYRYFGTHNPLTRGQMAAFLYRMNQKNLAYSEQSTAAQLRGQYEQSIHDQKLTRGAMASGNYIPSVMGEAILSDKIYDMITATGFEVYEKLEEKNIESLKGFNTHWKRFDDKSQSIIKNKNPEIEDLDKTGFSLEFDDKHFLTFSDNQFSSDGVDISVSMNLFTTNELAYLLTNLTGFKVTTTQVEKAATGTTVVLKSSKKQFYSIEGSKPDITMQTFSTKYGLGETGHRFFRITINHQSTTW